MAQAKDDDCPVTRLSSPPCYMSEVDPAYMGLEDTGNCAWTLSLSLAVGGVDMVLHEIDRELLTSLILYQH